MAEKTTNYNLTKPSADDFYDVGVQNGNMDIVDAELKKLNNGKAPEGHGLGGLAKEMSNVSFFETLKRGGGFYQVASAEDTPVIGETSRLNLIQCVRSAQENMETGVQLVFYDWLINNPRFWMRNVLKGTPGNWVEMLHTGNISSHANKIISVGSYVGTGKFGENNPNTLTLGFKPRAVIIMCSISNMQNRGMWLNTMTSGYVYCSDNSSANGYVSLEWRDNGLSWYSTNSSDWTQLNHSGYTYYYIAIG